MMMKMMKMRMRQYSTIITPNTNTTINQRYKICVAYNGVVFGGWQKQRESSYQTPPRHMKPNIQQVLENSLNHYRNAFRESETSSVRVHGSSRTDANVHAFMNTCHVDLTHSNNINEHVIHKMMNSYLLNANLFSDLKIQQVEKVPQYYHSRYCAYERTYMYRIIETHGQLDKLEDKAMGHPFLSNKVYFIRNEIPLDINAMRNASQIFVGRHNFSSFCKLASVMKSKKDPIREIITIEILEVPISQFIQLSNNNNNNKKQSREIQFHIKGKSFLHHQVRYMIQALLQIGSGQWTLDQLKQLLMKDHEQQERKMKLIPGWGLYLCNVKDCSQYLQQQEC
jgi:tRNA pseudouridine38-40 synthase